MKKKGVYIVFEGIVGSGKSTQSKLLALKLREKFPNREIVWTREPGGSEIAGAIRKIVQASEFEEEMEPICEAYLFAAARAHTLRRIVKPVLGRGGVIISDRSYNTSIAYQGAARNLGPEVVYEINKIAVENIVPDKIFMLNVIVDHSIRRTRDKIGDKFERFDLSFFKRAVAGYKFAEKKAGKIWENIDGSETIEQIHDKIFTSVQNLLK